MRLGWKDYQKIDRRKADRDIPDDILKKMFFRNAIEGRDKRLAEDPNKRAFMTAARAATMSKKVSLAPVKWLRGEQ